MTGPAAPTVVALNLVRPERADDFEVWLRDVVVAAAREHRPQDLDRWQVLRAERPDADAVAFVFLFSGGSPQDSELLPLLEQALGPQGAQRALADMTEMLVEEQLAWDVRPVPLLTPG